MTRLSNRPDSRRWRLLLCCVTLSLAAATQALGDSAEFGAPPAPGPAPVMPASEVTRGMKGVGWTVFSGDEITPFGVEILGVMKRSRPQGDLILFRGMGEVLEHTGIIAGMSGSPVYVDGKLVGAVAFAYPGAIDPIGAITPIGEMLPLLSPSLGPPPDPDASSSRGNGRVSDGARSSSRSLSPARDDADATSAQAFQQLWNQFLTREPADLSSLTALPEGSAARAGDPVDLTNPARLRAMSIPVALQGWAPALEGEMSRALAREGMLASVMPLADAGTVAAASGAKSDGGGAGQGLPGSLVPGGAIGVNLVQGDASLSAIGTVTYVNGDEVLAFGHPMVQGGRVAFPMTTAWIHGVVPTNGVSFKMGTAVNPVGGIYDDRREGIAGVLGGSPDLLPVRVDVTDPDGRRNPFRYRLVRNPFLTPFFLPWTVANSFLADGWSLGEASVTAETKVYYDGNRVVTRRERLSTDTPPGSMGSDLTLPATLLLVNPFEKVRLDSVRVNFAYERRNASAKIKEVHCSPVRAEVGDSLRVEVEIEPFRGESETRRLSLPVPAAWAGRKLRVLVASTQEFVDWDKDRAPEKFIPHSMEQLVEMITRVPDDGVLTLRVYAEEPGVLLQGIELPGLPPSIAAVSASPGSKGGLEEVAGLLLEERRLETPWVLSGGEQVEVRVAQ